MITLLFCSADYLDCFILHFDVRKVGSKFVAKKVGLSLADFTAVLKNPQQSSNSKLFQQVEPFAWVTARILRSLGGEYVKVADEIQPKKQGKERIHKEVSAFNIID